MGLHGTLLLLSGYGFFCCFANDRRFFYIDTPMNWTEGQLYCRDKFTDLATLRSMDEVNSLKRPAGMKGLVWIGLNDFPASWRGTMGNDSNSWRWSTVTPTFSAAGYQNWKNGEPNFGGGYQTCVSMSSNGKWSDDNCTLPQTFVCYTDVAPNVKTYTFISTAMTWADAQAHCRTHHTDLAVVQSAEDNTQVLAELPTFNVTWLALSREPFRWSDGSSGKFTYWKLDEPNNGRGDQPCVAENVAHRWADYLCYVKNPVLCYADPVRHNWIQMMITMKADQTDPEINDQIVQQLTPTLGSELVYKLVLKWTIPPEEPPEEILARPCVARV